MHDPRVLLDLLQVIGCHSYKDSIVRIVLNDVWILGNCLNDPFNEACEMVDVCYLSEREV